MQEESLDQCFHRIFKSMKDISAIEQSQIPIVLYQIEHCSNLVSREALFSKNEELDDIATESLKYLCLDYYRGKCFLSLHDLDARDKNIESGKLALEAFVTKCLQYKLIHENEMKKLDSSKPMNPEEKRNYKIEKFKREKVARQRINELTRLLAITKQDTDIDHEEEQRELYLLTLQSFLRDSLDELDMIQEEINMLKFRKELEYSMENNNDNLHNNQNPTARHSLLPPQTNYADRSGISVTRTFKVGDQLMISRDTVKSEVFGSNIAPPTMSLADFGDAQKQDAEERAQRQAESEGKGRRYKDLLAAGEEDDLDLMDEATLEDRKWDDWKDNNPRGWGNKMGKRF